MTTVAERSWVLSDEIIDRCGRRAATIHPASSMLVHEIVGKSALGVLGEYPRWG